MRRVATLVLAAALTGCGTTVDLGAGRAGGALDGTGLEQTGPAAPQGGDGGLQTDPTGGPGVGAGAGPPGTSKPASGSSPTGPSSAPAGTARVTKPLLVGMILTSTAGAGSIGLKLDNSYSERQMYDALISALNARGGLGGRPLKAVYHSTDPLGQNWSQQYAEVCSAFTQDHHVDLVLGYSFNYDPAFESCLARKRIPHLSTTFNVPDAAELGKYPLLLNVEVPTIGRRTLLKVDGAVATGVLTRTSRVGAVYDTCPGTGRSYQAEAKPIYARHHLNVVSEFQLTCVQGNEDSGRAQAEIQALALRFASRNVTHVLFHTVSEGPAMAFLMQTANSQRWYPTYVMSSLANLMFATTNPQLVPEAQARNVKAFGWMPFEDVTVDKYPPVTSAQKRCRDLFASKGLVLRSSLDFKIAYTTCEVLFIAERALTATRGNSDGTTFIRAVQGLGSSFSSVSKLGGLAAFGPDRHDAVRRTRPLVWFDACACFDYTGQVRDIPAR